MTERDVSNIAVKILKADFLAMDQAVASYKERHGEYPPRVHLNQDTKKGDYVTIARFLEMRNKRWIPFREAQAKLGIYEPGTKKGRRPNYIYTVHPTPSSAVTVTPTIKEASDPYIYLSPRYLKNLDQENNYYCAPTMAEQLLYELYGFIADQDDLARQAGTTTSGTGHYGVEKTIELEAEQRGHKCIVTFQAFTSLASTLDQRFKALGELVQNPNIGAGIHCLYRNKWGHYMTPVYVNLKTRIIGFSDSLNEADILYVNFDTAASWIANTTGGQPSVIRVTKIY